MAVLRLATEKDIPGLLALYSQLAFNTPEDSKQLLCAPGRYRKALVKLLSSPGAELIVAEEAGKVVGTLTLVIIHSLVHDASPWAVVEHLVVGEKLRRKGIGKMLMEYAVAKAKKAGCYKIQLSSDKRRRSAHKFYRSLAFNSCSLGFRRYF